MNLTHSWCGSGAGAVVVAPSYTEDDKSLCGSKGEFDRLRQSLGRSHSEEPNPTLRPFWFCIAQCTMIKIEGLLHCKRVPEGGFDRVLYATTVTGVSPLTKDGRRQRCSTVPGSHHRAHRGAGEASHLLGFERAPSRPCQGKQRATHRVSSPRPNRCKLLLLLVSRESVSLLLRRSYKNILTIQPISV